MCSEGNLDCSDIPADARNMILPNFGLSGWPPFLDIILWLSRRLALTDSGLLLKHFLNTTAVILSAVNNVAFQLLFLRWQQSVRMPISASEKFGGSSLGHHLITAFRRLLNRTNLARVGKAALARP